MHEAALLLARALSIIFRTVALAPRRTSAAPCVAALTSTLALERSSMLAFARGTALERGVAARIVGALLLYRILDTHAHDKIDCHGVIGKVGIVDAVGVHPFALGPFAALFGHLTQTSRELLRMPGRHRYALLVAGQIDEIQGFQTRGA